VAVSKGRILGIDGENPYLFKGACSSYISAAAANTGERARYAG